MNEYTLNIPFRCLASNSSEHPGVEFHYVDHPMIRGGYYGPQSKAKTKFRGEITDAIERGLRAAQNTDVRVIACKDGTVLVVLWQFDGWMYLITGPNRKFNGSCSGYTSYQEAIDKAKNHAEQCFGGIIW